jgi:hypothetical protein
LPNRQEGADEYPYPQYSDSPSVILKTADEVLSKLEQAPLVSYDLSWHNQEHEISPGFVSVGYLFFGKDGSLVAGLTVYEENDYSDRFDGLLVKMAKCVNAKWGYIAGAGLPPESSEEFIEKCKSSSLARILDGKLTK